MIKSVIIEGVDRLGKDSLIKGIKDEIGYFNTVHYQKPELLKCFLNEARKQLNRGDSDLDDTVKNYALSLYQRRSFSDMFSMLSSDTRYIMNRAHLGEFVYSPRYRKYDGSYVFELENHFINDRGSKFHDTTLLVLLHTSDFSFIKDDGLSFDWDKKEEEQNDFIRAFERSQITNKVMIDVHDGDKHFVPFESILMTVLYAYYELPKMHDHNMNVSWNRSNPQGHLERVALVTPDPKKIVF
jgi:hypothetical protein